MTTKREEKAQQAREAWQIGQRKDFAQWQAMGLFAEFHASPMAAGPCSAAAALDGKRVTPGSARVTPLADCTHPDQCGCMYQAKLGLTGEF